jgi:hypothetical protein
MKHNKKNKHNSKSMIKMLHGLINKFKDHNISFKFIKFKLYFKLTLHKIN